MDIEIPVTPEEYGRGYLALPEADGGPGVLVLHAGWGLTPFFKQVCDRLAREGFVVLAPDLYGGQTAKSMREADELSDRLDGDRVYTLITAAVYMLREHPLVEGDGIGVVGFSLGGAWGLLLEEGISAVVTFYGMADPQYVTAKAAYQGHFAEVDEHELAEAAKRMMDIIRVSGRSVEEYTYPGTRHWFFEADRPQYNQQAAELAWERTIRFLKKELAGEVYGGM